MEKDSALQSSLDGAWHSSWWARGAMALALAAFSLGLAVGLSRYRLRSLESMVESRTTELAATVRELEAANTRAGAANTAKSDFLATMSHEIRNPLNGVIGTSDLLRQTDLSAEQAEYVETIRISGDALLAIIDDVLDFSKIQAGQLELEEHDFDLRLCVEEAVELLALKASEQGLELVCLFPPQNHSAVVGDSVRLRQVIINLLSNAIKFTKQGEVCVSATTSAIDDRWLQVSLAVRDTGIGISRAAFDHLFKPFSQVDSSTTREYGGTGLGLAITRRICELMGGGITVDSTEGIGTTFVATVRVQRQSLDPQEPHRDLLAGNKVLVVAGNPSSRRALACQVEALGGAAVLTNNINRALEVMKSGTAPPVILADLHLDDGDGFALAASINDLFGHGITKVILLTPRHRRVETGGTFARMTLAKPVRLMYLESALRICLGGTDESTREEVTEQPNYCRGDGPPLRILLADDSKISRDTCHMLLEHLGYTADQATTGIEVLAAVSRHDYDLILMDVHMPKMDGIEASRRIRSETTQTGRPYIVAVSADVTSEVHNECRDAGMDDILTKPVTLEQLAEVLAKID